MSSFQKNLKVDAEECKFFSKVGCCRFGSRCNRLHRPPQENSTQILIQQFFDHPRLSKQNPRYDESSDDELMEAYEKFYGDVHGKFSAIGEIVTFRCCRNPVNHLRGTVYIEYAEREAAVEALKMFNNTIYNGRRLARIYPFP